MGVRDGTVSIYPRVTAAQYAADRAKSDGVRMPPSGAHLKINVSVDKRLKPDAVAEAPDALAPDAGEGEV